MTDPHHVIATYLRCVNVTPPEVFKPFNAFSDEERTKYLGWANELTDYLEHCGYVVIPKIPVKPAAIGGEGGM